MKMIFKIGYIVTIIMTVVNWSLAGFHSLGIDGHHQHHHHPHVSVAQSFMHFHGPVEGPDFEVKVPYYSLHDEHNYLHGDHHEHHDHHDHYSLDYTAHPKYQFSYGVEDHHTGDFHGQKEHRDGNSVHGEYSVKEPGGTIRVVSYHADKDGFHAVVHTSGKNDHSGGTYGGHGQDHYYQGYDREDHHEQGLQNYATHSSLEGYS